MSHLTKLLTIALLSANNIASAKEQFQNLGAGNTTSSAGSKTENSENTLDFKKFDFGKLEDLQEGKQFLTQLKAEIINQVGISKVLHQLGKQESDSSLPYLEWATPENMSEIQFMLDAIDNEIANFAGSDEKSLGQRKSSSSNDSDLPIDSTNNGNGATPNYAYTKVKSNTTNSPDRLLRKERERKFNNFMKEFAIKELIQEKLEEEHQQEEARR